jgi:hypothetical protein
MIALDSFDLPSDAGLPVLSELTGGRVTIKVNGKTLRIYEQKEQTWPGTKTGEKAKWLPQYRGNIAPI